MICPDYLIIGAMKCGTSTLAAQLGAQPGVFMTQPKEPAFFADDAVFSQGQSWYDKLFASADRDDVKGEASTQYTKLPTFPRTVERVRSAAIQAGKAPKLIYMLRDPVDRLISHYIHEWSQGVIRDPLDRALETHPELISYSCYGRQLTPWVEAFGSDIMVANMSELKDDPQGLLDRAGIHLGKTDLVWKHDLGRMNVSAERVRRFPLHGLVFANPLATWLRRNLIPQTVRDRIKAARQMQERPILSSASRAKLVETFRTDRSQFLALFPEKQNMALIYPEPK
ncbi:sulfotransferase domain-containing protein [Thioclava kandeliae]|uniref:Sulfotransferase domain-containing protein n=1 Tax=Thioclava kandeliae TaxID=3070818 RepID=A0ABV1SMB4_9RHOB